MVTDRQTASLNYQHYDTTSMKLAIDEQILTAKHI